MTGQATPAAPPIMDAENWLVAECARLLAPDPDDQALAGCPSVDNVDSGPGDWSDAYLERLLKKLPAVRVAFLEGAAQEGQAQDLVLVTRWAIYVLTGWRGQRAGPRRRGWDGGAGRNAGAYQIACLLAPALHDRLVTESNAQGQFHPDGEPVGMTAVSGVVNMWSEELEEKGISLFAVTLDLPVPMGDPACAKTAYDEFLKAGFTWDLPGVGTDADAASVVDVRQSEDQP